MHFKRTTLHLFTAVLLSFVLAGAAFSQTEKKSAQGILIDNSGSLRSQFPLVVSLGQGIVEQTHSRGPITLFAFNTPPKKERSLIPFLGIDWSQDKDLIDKYIQSIFIVPGQTTLLDGIDAIATHLNAKVAADKDAYGEKIIFLITDGEERLSKVAEKDLIKSLKTSGIKVYAVGLVQELENEGGLIRKPAKDKAIAFLNKITKETGGRAVIPKSKKVDVNAVLAELFAK